MSAKKNGFEELESDTFILAFATEPSYDKLETWAIQRGIIDPERVIQNTSTFIGRPYRIEGSNRIEQRIKDKIDRNQFDKKNLNILVIKYDDFFSSASLSEYFSGGTIRISTRLSCDVNYSGGLCKAKNGE